MDAHEALATLLGLLEEEETAIVALLELASAEHDALIASDFNCVDDITAKMLAIAERLESAEEQRSQLLRSLGIPGAGLSEVVKLAETHGMHGFAPAKERLLDATTRLQDTQEQNARLVLSAARMRERWLAMLTRMANPTYTADGANGDQGYRFVSKSA